MIFEVGLQVKINSTTYVTKVHTGWVYGVYENYGGTSSLVFIPDPTHETVWKIELDNPPIENEYTKIYKEFMDRK